MSASTNFMGYAPETLIVLFEAWEAVVHPEDLPRCQAVTQQALQGEGGSPLEFSCPASQWFGTVHRISLSCTTGC